MSAGEERFTGLEMRHAEQERAIEELSGQLAEQWTVIDRLQRTVERLMERMAALEEQATPRPEATRPPHY
jgi:SlyX protein